ncbi:Olfactory receptor 9A4 [Lemmus lemmus]
MDNLSSATEFCLLDFPGSQELRHVLSTISFSYSVTLFGNMIIIMIICVDKCLQFPMYFLLAHLSLLESLVTTIVPMMLWGLLLPGTQTISLTECVVKLFLYLSLGTTEFAILGAMAVDCYVAVCNPLRYSGHHGQSYLHLGSDCFLGIWYPF